MAFKLKRGGPTENGLPRVEYLAIRPSEVIHYEARAEITLSKAKKKYGHLAQFRRFLKRLMKK